LKEELMNTPITLMIVVALIIIGLAIFIAITQKSRKETPNYRSWFFIGLCWIPVGIVTKNPAFLAIGVIFTVIGLVNKNKWKEEKKWSELTPAEKRLKIILLSVVAILLIAGVVVFFLQRSEVI
jgi:flagellar basal body-associated protein FliL